MDEIGGFFGRLLLLPVHALRYTFNTDNWDNTYGDIFEDSLNALKEVVDGESRAKMRIYVKMCKLSEDLGVRVRLVKNGLVALSLRRSGNLREIKREVLDKLHREYPNMVLNRGTARIDIDIIDIQQDFRTENGVLGEISCRIRLNFKALSEAIDIYKLHYDNALVHSIARVLYYSNECKKLELSISGVGEGMVIIIANKGVVE